MGRALRAWWRRGAIASAALRRRATPTPALACPRPAAMGGRAAIAPAALRGERYTHPGSGVPATGGDGRGAPGSLDGVTPAGDAAWGQAGCRGDLFDPAVNRSIHSSA